MRSAELVTVFEVGKGLANGYFRVVSLPRPPDNGGTEFLDVLDVPSFGVSRRSEAI